MITLQSTTCYLICPPKFQNFPLSSSSSTSSHSFRPFHASSSAIPCHVRTTPPLSSAVVGDIVVTSEEELEFVEIGYISDVHGLQGEIRVKHNTDFPELRLGKPGKRWLRQQFYGKESIFEVELEAGRDHPGNKCWIVKLSGFDDVEQARQLVGSTFLANKSERPDLEEGEYYSRDLVGVRVVHKDTGEAVGTVVNVFDNGGNDLLHVMLEASSGSSPEDKKKLEVSESGPLVWIPFVEAIVPVVDLDKREIQISPPKGLLELNLRSNEKSKKERRVLDWRERKKFQRRLISAKKKLCDLEQDHIFHGLRYGEKSQRSFLAEQIVSVNSRLLQQAIKIVEATINRCNIKEFKQDFVPWNISQSLKISETCLTHASEETLDVHLMYRESGLKLKSEGKVATVLVFNRREKDNYNEADDADFDDSDQLPVSILESLLVDMNKLIEAEYLYSMPIILISPAEDIQLLQTLFTSQDYFNFNPEKVTFLAEERVPVVSCSSVDEKKNKVLMKSPWEVLQTPIGSGGIVSALLSNNVMDALLESGVEYVELCTLNERCACGNPLFLGFVQSCEPDIGIMTFEDKIELDDNFHIVLPMKSMKKLVSHSEKLPGHLELKSNSHVELVDKKWVDIIPATPNSYEFCSSLGSLLNACSLDNACLVEATD